MGLRALLERAWSDLSAAVHVRTAAELFRAAERLRRDGRYHQAAELARQGLRRSPGSPAGHILDAYLNVVSHKLDAAREAFERALALRPEPPRALLALARISLDRSEGDAARRYLERWLEYHSGFPDQQEHRDGAANRFTGPPGAAARRERIPLPPGARDMVLAQLAGPVLLARCERARQPGLTRQATAVTRLAAPMLARAGLGPLRCAAIEGAAEAVFLRAAGALVLSIAQPSSVAVEAGLANVERLWTETVGERSS